MHAPKKGNNNQQRAWHITKNKKKSKQKLNDININKIKFFFV